MTPLATFQHAFANALFAPETDSSLEALTSQPAFAIYRNTVMKGCIDALEANFPSVCRLVGRDWFRAAAALHAAAEPPRDGRLLHYGAAFAAFLRRFEPAADLSYLPGVAELDALWCEAHVAPDAAPVDAAWLARCAPEQIGRLSLAPHPAARWRWFDGLPVFTIWQRNRSTLGAAGGDIVWHGEGALITRPFDVVAACPIGPAHGAFLDACGRGQTLAFAADCALGAEPDIDLSALLADLLRAGALTTDPTSSSNESSA